VILLSLFLSTVAQAQDCGAIPKALKTASPHEAAGLYVELAACDAASAKKLAASTLPSLIGNEGGQRAAMAAIRVGAGTEARDWVRDLESDERAEMVSVLGKACGEDPAVQAFLGETAAAFGEDFWSQRWYRSLVQCRVPAIQKILTDRVEASAETEDQVRYFAVVSAWAANVAGDAVPKLEEMIGQSKDVAVQMNLVGAFADAAQVGTLEGTDAKVAEAGADAIKRLSPTLAAKAVEQARNTLLALGDEQGSDALARVRYNAFLQSGDVLLYGVLAIETATCKNGKVQQYVHVAVVTDPGQTWPDQLEEKVSTSIQHAWKLNLAERCKGEGTTVLKLPDAPFVDEGAHKEWVDDEIKKATHEDLKKPIRKDHDPIAL